ncbi:polysialyltransferase family glycosyltransferase, partial [Enterovibrio norvegicus]|uniref:polysialyltransferase family glycosyltransferase n=1 Tax=Enterovibrio norvegicus TaxID=188144 RepID=UPI003551D4CA
IYIFPIQIFKTLSYKKTSEYNVFNHIKNLSDERNAFIDYAREFDSINVAYPNAIEGVFKSDKVNALNTYSTYESGVDLNGLIDKYNISLNDNLYLSQMYPIPSEAYADAVLSVILDNLHEHSAKCFIKFHPRDKTDFIDYIKSKVETLGFSELVVIIEESDFPIEALIKSCQFNKIMGISTTALVYANQLSPATDCISITNTLIRELGSNCPPKAKRIILEHTKMLTIFDHIKFN